MNDVFNNNTSTPDTATTPQKAPAGIGFLSSCFINSIYEGVSLNEFVHKIEDKSEEDKVKSNDKEKEATNPSQSPPKMHSSAKGDSPALSKYRKNAVTLSKQLKVAKSMSQSYCSNQDNINDSLITTYKVSTETEKQRRQYEDKVKAMRNRLNALKKQEDDLSKKMNAFHNKERELEQVKAEKEMLRNALKKYKESQSQLIESKKQKNSELKETVQLKVKEAMTKMTIKKHAEFAVARSEKQTINTMINENAEELDSINQKKIESIRSTYETFKAEEAKRKKERQDKLKKYYLSKMEKDEEETKALKRQIAEMEKKEVEYLQSLRTTQKENEGLFKGSWLLKTGEEQPHHKINVNLGNYAKTTKNKNTNSDFKAKTNNKQSSKQSHHREKSVEVGVTPHSNTIEPSMRTQPKKKAARSIEKPSKGK